MVHINKIFFLMFKDKINNNQSLTRTFPIPTFSSVQSLSRVRLFATPWTAARLAGVYPNPCPSSQWRHPTISSSVDPFSCPQSFPASGSFQTSQLQHQSFQWTPRTDLLQNGLVGSPCSPWDSQDSSPTPQFKSINSLVLSLLYSPVLTSIHD